MKQQNALHQLTESSDSQIIRDSINRDHCVFTGNHDLEKMHIFERFPIFSGCTDNSAHEDRFMDMCWSISKGSGSIQLNPLVPLDTLYSQPHFDAFGSTWDRHHLQFASFACHYIGSSVFEVGGGTGKVARNAKTILPNVKWTLLDANARQEDNPSIEVIKGFLTENTHLQGDWDTAVHSHLIEHMYEPIAFLRQLRRTLPKNGKHIFTLPNMNANLQQHYTNCLFFEHTCFMQEDFIDWALAHTGYKIIEKSYFEQHSIFYATEVVEPNTSIACPNFYDTNLKLYNDFIAYNRAIAHDIKGKMEKSDGPTYLFGAHIFAQYLLNLGVDETALVGVLDNSSNKIGRRLYGTNLMVQHPSVLKGIKNPKVILRAAAYSEEIKRDILKNHNSDVEFW